MAASFNNNSKNEISSPKLLKSSEILEPMQNNSENKGPENYMVPLQ